MSNKKRKIEFSLRTIEEGRLGRNEMQDIIGGTSSHCNPLKHQANCANMLRTCGGKSDSVYVGNFCPKGTTGPYTCNNCYWVNACQPTPGYNTCGGTPDPYSPQEFISWGGGASVEQPSTIITELTEHPSLYTTSCELYFGEMDNMIVSQNQPNPFNDTTVIECYVLPTIRDVVLEIYDMNDVLIHTIAFVERGKVNIEIHANELPSVGTYKYMLVGSGKTSNEMQMILE
ncbi:MAG TPA: hypothetical protein PLF32_08240 [Bacteroidales bacterium]|nr:hypothetical protein [Bacteroidales bacterium]HOR82630.1 hypothetical protein [Bacteroidales bacterium]HPJ91821.1 hypothetical protein [Bacteroidales bacterium]